MDYLPIEPCTALDAEFQAIIDANIDAVAGPAASAVALLEDIVTLEL
jgi:hypothetical protein